MADNQDFSDDVKSVASKMPADNRYGQNGFLGPSSDEPGKHTTSGFLPQVKVPTDSQQTRTISDKPYPAAHGMKATAPPAAFPKANTRAVNPPKQNSSFQRR